MCKVQGPLLAVRGLLWCAVLTWARAAWLRRLARCVIGGVPVSRAVEVGVGIEWWAFRNGKSKAGVLNIDLGSEFGASCGRCIGPFPSLMRDPTLHLLRGSNMTILGHHHSLLLLLCGEVICYY
jgi:hypothetical protein